MGVFRDDLNFALPLLFLGALDDLYSTRRREKGTKEEERKKGERVKKNDAMSKRTAAGLKASAVAPGEFILGADRMAGDEDVYISLRWHGRVREECV